MPQNRDLQLREDFSSTYHQYEHLDFNFNYAHNDNYVRYEHLTMTPQQPFYFIRHGETDWNRNRIFMGQQDIPLNSSGIQQAQEAAQNLTNVEIASIAASPLIRAAKTAEIIAEAIKKPITYIEDLKECCWGAVEGQAVDDGTLFRNWLGGENYVGAETAEGFKTRVVAGVHQALTLPSPVLIVSHGGVYAMIRRYLSLSLPTSLSNCAAVYHRPPEHPTHPWFACELIGTDAQRWIQHHTSKSSSICKMKLQFPLLETMKITD